LRILERDDASGSDIHHFHRATTESIDFLCIVFPARLRIRHLVI
jgi:hypothetical protein